MSSYFGQFVVSLSVVSFQVGQETLEEVQPEKQHLLSARVPLRTQSQVVQSSGLISPCTENLTNQQQ